MCLISSHLDPILVHTPGCKLTNHGVAWSDTKLPYNYYVSYHNSFLLISSLWRGLESADLQKLFSDIYWKYDVDIYIINFVNKIVSLLLLLLNHLKQLKGSYNSWAIITNSVHYCKSKIFIINSIILWFSKRCIFNLCSRIYCYIK